MHAILLNIIGVLGAVFLFGFAVFVHELGHFIVAKWCGVGVKKFAIGFGSKIWWTVWRGTEYSIRWIPVGGFVALKGMIEGFDDEDEAGGEEKDGGADAEPEDGVTHTLTQDLDALRNKPALVRIAVFLAGVTCNFLAAMVFMAVLLWYGTPVYRDLPNVIERIPEGTRLHALGWRSGDQIADVRRQSDPRPSASLAGKPFANWGEAVRAFRKFQPPAPRSLLWRSLTGQLAGATDGDDDATTLVVTVVRGDQTVEVLTPLGLPPGEDVYLEPPRPAYVAEIVPNSPAHRARMVKDDYTPGERIMPYPAWSEMPRAPIAHGDTILAVNGQAVETWRDMEKLLHKSPAESVTLTVRRGEHGRVQLLTTTLERSDRNHKHGQLGIHSLPQTTGEREGLPLWKAIVSAPLETLELADGVIYLTVDFFRTATSRSIKRNVGGPMAIGIMAFKSAKRGLGDYLRIFIVISILLAFLNIMPIPVLDGGYILFTIVEAIIRRPVPQKVLVPILTVFMFGFVMLFVFLLYNDVMNWILKI